LSRRIAIAGRGICTVVVPERDEQRNARRDDHNERYRLDLHGGTPAAAHENWRDRYSLTIK
jgi:hypothetical protein